MVKNPLDIAYNRLDEAHRAWHNALTGYHQIDDFRAGINTAIQALRNLTFALQKQKDSLSNFDNWYAGWREKMKNDPILKELHEARNVIVKQEDLKLHSVAKARTKGWVDFEKVVFTFDPMGNSYDVAKGFYDTYARHLPVAEEVRKRLVFEFERGWVYEKLPKYELLEAIAQAYHFFYEMLEDASLKFSLPLREKLTTGEYCPSEFNDLNKLKCMIITPQDRCLTFSFKDGTVLKKMRTEPIFRNDNDFKEVQERYGDEWKSKETLSLLGDVFPKEYPFNQMKLFTQVAIGNLKKDKHLIPISFIFKENEKIPPIIIPHPFRNQEEKIMIMDKVAGEIIKNNGKFVLNLAEAWNYKNKGEKTVVPTEDNTVGAEDILQISCLSAEKLKIIFIPFHKEANGEISFKKPLVEDCSSDKSNVFILFPLIMALKKVK